MESKKWYHYIPAYLLWLIPSMVGVWIMLMSRNVFVAIGGHLCKDEITCGWRWRFYDKVFFIAVGLFWLLFIIGLESYFHDGVERGTLLRRVAKALGPELLLLAVVDFLLIAVQGLNAPGMRWPILVGELFIGGALTFLGWFWKKKPVEEDVVLEEVV